MVRCLHGAGENGDSRELARESEMTIRRRVVSYRDDMVEVMIKDINIIILTYVCTYAFEGFHRFGLVVTFGPIYNRIYSRL